MSYVYPPMPLLANLWYEEGDLPPTHPADEIVRCSISPIRPEDYFRQTQVASPAPGTHIIRTAPNPNIGDRWDPPSPTSVDFGSVFEVPIGSGHFYWVLWYHEVGAGFPNHHARIYALRTASLFRPFEPIFRGWI